MHYWQLSSVLQPKKLFVCAVLTENQASHPFPSDVEYYWLVLTLIDRFSFWQRCVQSHRCEFWPLLTPYTSVSLFLQFRIWPKNWVLASRHVVSHFCYTFSRTSFFPSNSSLAPVLSDYPSSTSIPLSLSLFSPPVPCHGNWLRKIMQTYLALSEISLFAWLAQD